MPKTKSLPIEAINHREGQLMSKWLPEEIEILKSMIEAGFSNKEIRQVLKSRSETAVYRKARELGLSLSPKPVIDYEAYKNFMRIIKA